MTSTYEYRVRIPSMSTLTNTIYEYRVRIPFMSTVYEYYYEYRRIMSSRLSDPNSVLNSGNSLSNSVLCI